MAHIGTASNTRIEKKVRFLQPLDFQRFACMKVGMDIEKPIGPEVIKFTSRVLARLTEGERMYSNRSLLLPTARLLDEVQQELEDVAGWGALLWVRLERLRERVVTQGEPRHEEGDGS